MFRLRPLALFGAGLILGASVGLVSAAIPASTGVYSACYEAKGGTVHLIDSSVTSCPKGELGPVSWNQTGPQGSPGPAGPAGPQGSPGLIGSLEDVDGLPCASGSGSAQLVEDGYTGLEQIACVTGLLGLATDPWNNTFGTAAAVTVACGGTSQFNGTTVPVGTSDWFKVSYTLTSACPELRIRISSAASNPVRFDLLNANGVMLNGDGHELNGCYQLSTSIVSPNPVWIRVWAPYQGSSYVLVVDEGGPASNCPLG
jgi:hypothetical protein